MDNNNVKEVILLAALWIFFFVCMSNKLLSGIYKDLAFSLCIIATIFVIGIHNVIQIISDFVNMVIRLFHTIFILIISFFAVLQALRTIVSSICSVLKIQANTNLLVFLILFVWVVLLCVYFIKIKEQVCCDLMLTSVALPAIHVYLMTRFPQMFSSDSIYIIIFVLFFLCVLLSQDAPATKAIHTIFFNSITFAAMVGYYQKVVHNRSISYVLLFIIAFLAQCLIHYGVIVKLYKKIRDSLKTKPSGVHKRREQSHHDSKEEYIKELEKKLKLELEERKNDIEKE